jgi:hypothetical protein
LRLFKKYLPIIQKIIQVAPLAIPASIATFSVIAILFLVTDSFYPEVIWPFGLIVSAMTFWVVYKKTQRIKRPGSQREQFRADLIVVALVIGWTLFNGAYTSQHLYTNRDPAVYAVTGAWLTKHNDLKIPKVNVFGSDSSIYSSSLGFGDSPVNSDRIFSQGMHLLPAFLGLIGSVVGVGGMLHANVLFGGIALLALYGFARYLARPRWAVVATAALATTLPLIHFSRDTYTEPLTAVFTFGALGLLWAAQISRSKALWFLTGVTAGAGVLARVDAYLVLIGLAAFLVIYNLLIEPALRKETLKNTGLLIIGALICGVLAWIDITKLSDGYYASQWEKLIPEIVLLVSVILSGIIAIIVGWRTSILQTIGKHLPRKLPIFIAITIVLAAGVLASRPLWHEEYGMRKVVDSATGIEIKEKTRNYKEESVNWVIWYMGPVTPALGLAGLASAGYIVTRRRNMFLLPGLIVVATISFFYLLKPSIASDQIWASRRLLPVIMPGLAVFSVIGLDYIHRQRKTLRLGVSGETFAAVLATLMIVPPLFISQPFLTARTLVPQLTQLNEVCASLPDKSAIIWAGEARNRAVQPTRTFCDVPSVGVEGDLDKSKLSKAAESARQKGYFPLIGVFSSDLGLVKNENRDSQMTIVSSIETVNLNLAYTAPPKHLIKSKPTVLIGVIQEDGTVKKL